MLTEKHKPLNIQIRDAFGCPIRGDSRQSCFFSIAVKSVLRVSDFIYCLMMLNKNLERI